MLRSGRYSFLLKETAGAFDGFRTYTWQASTYYMSDALTNVPRQLLTNAPRQLLTNVPRQLLTKAPRQLLTKAHANS